MTHTTTYSLLIYRATAGESVPADAARAMQGHRALQAEAAANGDLHAVARLDGVDRARTVRCHGAAHDVTDGPYVDTKEWLVGFYLLECRDESEALARARQICPDAGHAVEVRPVTWRWRA